MIVLTRSINTFTARLYEQNDSYIIRSFPCSHVYSVKFVIMKSESQPRKMCFHRRIEKQESKEYNHEYAWNNVFAEYFHNVGYFAYIFWTHLLFIVTFACWSQAYELEVATLVRKLNFFLSNSTYRFTYHSSKTHTSAQLIVIPAQCVAFTVCVATVPKLISQRRKNCIETSRYCELTQNLFTFKKERTFKWLIIQLNISYAQN